MKKVLLFVVGLIITNVVMAQTVRFHFYATEATGYSSNVYLDGSMVCLVKDGSYYMLYDSTATINNINSINGEIFTINKNGKALTSGAEWYSFDNSGKKHYYAQNKSYTAGSIVKELGLGSSDLVIVDLYANWDKVDDVKEEKSENPNLQLKRKDYKLKVGKITTLHLNNSTSATLTWTSSNKKVATVDSNGKVTAKSVGKATITVKDNYGHESSCNIEVVSDSTYVVKIIYDMNGGKLDKNHGENITTSGSVIKCRGNKYCQNIIYNSTTADSGLFNYNNSNYINIIKDGYVIKANNKVWNTKKDGTGKSYSQNKLYKSSDFCNAKNNNCEITLYANWVKESDKEITVTYNSNGGKGCNESFKVKANTDKTYGDYDVKKMCVPESNGDKVFAGWYTAKTGGKKVEIDTKIANTSNHTLYAHWRPYTGNIYFLNTGMSSESILIRSDDGHYVLLDTSGIDKNLCTELVNNVKNIIKTNKDLINGKAVIDYLVLSHQHGDHFGCTEYFMKNTIIKNVILKNYDMYRMNKKDSRLTTLRNKKEIVIDTTKIKKNDINGIKSNEEYINVPIGNTGRTNIKIFNYHDAYKSIKKNNKPAKDQCILHPYFIALRKEKDLTDNINELARDKNGNFYYIDGINANTLKKASNEDLVNLLKTNGNIDENGAYRYYVIKIVRSPSWNENAESLALLVEFKTNEGKKYAYLPSDLENNGVTYLADYNSENIMYTSGTSDAILIASSKTKDLYNCDDENKIVKEPVLKTKKVNNKLIFVSDDKNRLYAPQEALTAEQVIKVVKNPKNLLVYQPSHHVINNDIYAVKKLGIYDGTSGTYFIAPKSVGGAATGVQLRFQRSYFWSSINAVKAGRFTYAHSNLITNTNFNAIVANYKNSDGKVEVEGKYLKCEKASKATWNDCIIEQFSN